MIYMYAFFSAFLLVLLLVPIVREAARRLGFVDRPTKRKMHTSPVPLSGGLAIYIGVIGMAYLYVGDSSIVRVLALGGGLLVAIGLVDDGFKAYGKEFPVWPRLIVYIGVAILPVGFGISIQGISAPSHSAMLIFSDGWSVFFTALWIFSLINMMNFIDGVDGLASGVCVISSLTLFVASLLGNQEVIALLAIALAGSCLAFLTYNFHPAKIFMGDAGATFLGFTLAVLAIEGTLKGATFLSISVPLLALGVPILDTVITFSRRLLVGKGLHRADNLHTHHTLMRWGLSQVQTVSFLYLIAAVFALMSIVILLILR
ncbi:MraY family glycosyltransferase [Cohnella thailandensis]|uniref:Undecaprenyl/decaprenyl-phosphate alpha-N-acetylglucosaminyl 1-phosphate transferase n=1 Tax=Cohnella thailandensis TaxID=557557 RepID=A0A841T070_9BACL|nr:MraY family glycosyltransferase [Cohnella thailandensis]MBB6637544.1 undecaprenyl/decaprenyl-phosphate alpha-N-acetylglucosaminyl 1-phosphate transferase [Cohnella thailandensis]MBP1974280.1 UDP-GlcNAc:undecaprenyl-phosphate GlcNAc-1-phosphate transferase [Cohnella thailandensis]